MYRKTAEGEKRNTKRHSGQVRSIHPPTDPPDQVSKCPSEANREADREADRESTPVKRSAV